MRITRFDKMMKLQLNKRNSYSNYMLKVKNNSSRAKVRNMFKVENKETRTTSLMCLYF